MLAVAALSTTLSTAALDKHPQSKERGITLDLGFSSFAVSLPERLDHLPFDELQVTLVDCPGHASLIKTIIGGAQIIDMMLLVVDVNRGIQTQVLPAPITAYVLITTSLARATCIVGDATVRRTYNSMQTCACVKTCILCTTLLCATYILTSSKVTELCLMGCIPCLLMQMCSLDCRMSGCG